MNDTDLGRNTVGFGLSVAIVSILSALLVVIKETNQDTVLAIMKAATGHHWVTHGILDVLLFLLFGFMLARANGGKGISMTGKTLTSIILLSVLVGWAIINGFFIM